MAKGNAARPEGLSYLDSAEYKQAVAFCPQVSQVDPLILVKLAGIFSVGDRRAVNGFLFIATILTYGTLIRRAASDGFGICEVASISARYIKELRKTHTLTGERAWIWCHDTTYKYLDILIARRLLFKHSVIQNGKSIMVYYFPLTYQAVPLRVEDLENLANARPKVRCSLAYQRLLKEIDKANPPLINKREKPAERRQPEETVKEESIKLVGRKDARKISIPGSIIREAAQSFLHLLSAAEVDITPQLVDGLYALVEQLASFLKTSPLKSQQGSTKAKSGSTNSKHVGLPSAEIVDPHQSLSACRSTISIETSRPTPSKLVDLHARNECIKYNNNYHNKSNAFIPETPLPDPSWSTSSSKLEDLAPRCDQGSTIETRMVDPVVGNASSGSTSSLEKADLVVEKPQDKSIILPASPFSGHPIMREIIGHMKLNRSDRNELAGSLASYFPSKNGNSNRDHYLRLLDKSEASAFALHSAAVDALVRGPFPDPGHSQANLGGGWVTDRYRAYVAGETVPPAILAWACTGYTYDEIEEIIYAAALYQDRKNFYRKRDRPFPDEVIAHAEELHQFWQKGGASTLISQGFLFVDTINQGPAEIRDYELKRAREILQIASDRLPEPTEDIAERSSFFHWLISKSQTASDLLVEKSMPVLSSYLDKLKGILDPDLYRLRCVSSPLSSSLVIEVLERGGQAPVKTECLPGEEIIHRLWHLASSKEIEAFLSQIVPPVQI